MDGLEIAAFGLVLRGSLTLARPGRSSPENLAPAEEFSHPKAICSGSAFSCSGIAFSVYWSGVHGRGRGSQTFFSSPLPLSRKPAWTVTMIMSMTFFAAHVASLAPTLPIRYGRGSASASLDGLCPRRHEPIRRQSYGLTENVATVECILPKGCLAR